MKSPRRIDLNDEVLSAVASTPTTPPPPTSLFWKMWKACIPTANNALTTPFVQGIKNANLNPVTYGGFNVNDAYYCFNGAQSYLAAESRTTDAGLKAFLLAKYNGYQKYNQEFVTKWRVRDARGVIPYPACSKYSSFEANVASHENPIYCLIVMIPCEYLWYWLGHELMPPSTGNLYADWITGNNDPSGAYKMGNYLDTFQAANPGVVDETHATLLYSQAMSYERQNFQAAT